MFTHEGPYGPRATYLIVMPVNHSSITATKCPYQSGERIKDSAPVSAGAGEGPGVNGIF